MEKEKFPFSFSFPENGNKNGKYLPLSPFCFSFFGFPCSYTEKNNKNRKLTATTFSAVHFLFPFYLPFCNIQGKRKEENNENGKRLSLSYFPFSVFHHSFSVFLFCFQENDNRIRNRKRFPISVFVFRCNFIAYGKTKKTITGKFSVKRKMEKRKIESVHIFSCPFSVFSFYFLFCIFRFREYENNENDKLKTKSRRQLQLYEAHLHQLRQCQKNVREMTQLLSKHKRMGRHEYIKKTQTHQKTNGHKAQTQAKYTKNTF